MHIIARWQFLLLKGEAYIVQNARSVAYGNMKLLFAVPVGKCLPSSSLDATATQLVCHPMSGLTHRMRRDVKPSKTPDSKVWMLLSSRSLLETIETFAPGNNRATAVDEGYGKLLGCPSCATSVCNSLLRQ